MKKQLLFFILLLVGTSVSAQTRLYVKQAGGSDSYNGQSWNAAFATFDKALTEANNNTSVIEIWVAEGKYIPQYKAGTGTEERDRAFTLPANVKIYGGFNGSENSLTERIPATDGKGSNGLTELNGEIAPGDTVYRVVVGTALNKDFLHLDGFTVQGKNIKTSSNDPSGAAIYLTISTNINNEIGGDIILENNTIMGKDIFVHSAISSASTYPQFLYAGNIIIRNNVIKTILDAYSSAYTIIGQAGTITVDNNIIDSPGRIFINASADSHGNGGIINFTNNKASAKWYISLSASEHHTHSPHNGKVINFDNNSIVAGDYISLNTTSTGWSNADGGTINMRNNTIIFTSESKELKFYAYARTTDENINAPGKVNIANTIIWGNNGNMQFESDMYQNLSLKNCLQQGKTADESDNFGKPGSGSGNLDGTTINADEVFDSVATGNYQLKKGSPAIDTGINSEVPAAITTDVDGLPRMVGSAVDIGAYEYQGTVGIGDIPFYTPQNVRIYTNTGCTILTIDGLRTSTKINVYDLNGSLQLSKNSTGTIEFIAIDNLPIGVYLVQAGNYVQKIVKAN